MNATEHLRQLIDEHERRLRAGIPPERQAALLALVRAIDATGSLSDDDAFPAVLSSEPGVRTGGNTALRICLESGIAHTKPAPETGARIETWAQQYLHECCRHVVARRVLLYVETGFMRVVNDTGNAFDAWIASGRAPASWRERVDFDWWTARLADTSEPELTRLRSELEGAVDYDARDRMYQSIARVLVHTMRSQAGYPEHAEIGGEPIKMYRDVLVELITRALRARDDGISPLVLEARPLVASIGAALSLGDEQVARVIAAFTFDEMNASYHATVPRTAPAPLVMIDSDHLAFSLHGLTAEPMLFAMRELRRRDPQAYHNAAWQREVAFRHDLYELFQDKRFVTSDTRIQLRRDKGGLRTDVDAAVFDRKTGVLALFELKAQDPFARSSAELTRQRDNVLLANHQIAGILDWLNRNGADELLNRIDHPTAKRFRVRKVVPFVLGRYLIHFPDGPVPDRRAAWGTWPQILRLTGGQAFSGKDGNPLTALFHGLRKEDPLRLPQGLATPQSIHFGDVRLTIFPSFAAYKQNRSHARDDGGD